jgi:hypothetical protein
MKMKENELQSDDFVLGVIWDTLPEGNEETPEVLVEYSRFNVELTSEEINILAILMMNGWL